MFSYIQKIQGKGYSADTDVMNRSVNAQMKAASRLNAKYALFIEPEENTVSVRNMDTSVQEIMTFDDFFALLEKDTELKKIT